MIDPTVSAVIDELETFQKTRTDAWNIPRDEGLALHALALAGGCRTLVEIGTSYGFSGLFLASAAKAFDGTLHTFDIDPRKHEHAARNFAKAGLDRWIRLHTGDARRLLAQMDGGVDFAFIDAAKEESFDYFAALEPKLARRCLVAVDNTNTHNDQLANFLIMLGTRGDFTYCNLPVGHGLGLAVRTA